MLPGDVHLGSVVAEQREHLRVVDLDPEGAEEIPGFRDDLGFEIIVEQSELWTHADPPGQLSRGRPP